MLQVTFTPTRARLVALTLASITLATFLAGCGGGGGSSDSGSATTGGTPGSIVAHPNPALFGSQTLVVDSNQGGGASAMIISRIAWGRLVDVRDVNDELQNVDYVIGENITTSGSYRLETNAVTAETTVTILHAAGTPAYETAFRQLDANLIPIQDKSLNPNELPPFSVVPRNAAIVVQFNDLLKRSSIAQNTVRLLTGNPPITPFTNARVLADNNHGDIVGEGANAHFETTRIIIDTTVSEIESQEASTPLQANALGLPASQTAGLANVALRIPTRRTLPADPLLLNLSGHPVSFTSNGPNEPTPSQEVVRAMRSGGDTSVTGDMNNGYLLDLSSPRIIGAQGVQVISVITLPANTFRVDMQFTATQCALQPRAGDVVQQGQVFVEVVQDGSPPAGGVVSDIIVRPVFPLDGVVTPGAGQFRSVYRPLDAGGKEACFVRFSPSALLPSSGSIAPGILTSARVTIAFSEPMNPSSVTPFDSLAITRNAANPGATDYVIGDITRTGDLKEFTFVPSLPFAHASGAADDYFLTLDIGTDGPTDLAGNGLVDALPQVTFTMEETQPVQDNGGFVLRFDQISEFPDADNAPELRGQFQYNFVREVIRPRPITRFSVVADRTQPLPSMMTTTPTGLQTPISGLGSKMQTVWRDVDLGIGLLDETTMNVDIEHLNWAPKALPVIQEFYPLFEIGLAHSLYLPDEFLNATTNLPQFAASGLGIVYANNLLDPTNDPLNIVHPRGLGYLIDPGKAFPSSTGTTMMPFPLNLTIPKSQYRYYTWRDTALLALGAPNGTGSLVANARPPAPMGLGPPVFAVNAVPTVGLPILMEFRCFPTKEFGLNGFDTNFALNSSPRPNFRIYSTGGTDASGSPVTKNPDLELQGSGGFNPNNGGATTIGADNTFYIGQLDLVTRISRVHSIWINSLSASPTYSEPVLEPRASDQPDGTQVVLAYRGATQVSLTAITEDAAALDSYGDAGPAGAPAGAPTFLNGDAKWKSGISAIQGAALLQFRITFIGNAETNLTAELSSLGFAFRR